MPRCSCPSGCLCAFTADPPLYITGDGSEGSPFTVFLAKDGFAGCGALVACLAEDLGAGLGWNPVLNQVQVKLSQQAGNTLTFGSDGGLFEADEPPTPAPVCGKTVAGLPSFIYAGNHGGAGLMKAYSCRQAVQYAVDMGLDMVEVDTQGTQDLVACVIRFGYEGQLRTKTNMLAVPDATTIENLSFNDWVGALVANGTSNNPQANVQANGWPKEGGWYGFLEAAEPQWSLLEWLRELDARAVAMIVPTSGSTVDNETKSLLPAIAAVKQVCAEAWSIIQVGYLASVPAIVAAGITPCVRIEIVGGNPVPTPAAVVAAGVQWVAVNRLMSAAQMTAFKDAGLQVLWHTGSRHWQTNQALSLGIRGIRAADPVYARGVDAAGQAWYRWNTDKWRLKRRQPGQLNNLTDGYYDFLNGYHNNDYTNTSLIQEPFSSQGLRHSGLQPGWCLPLPVEWTSYTVTVSIRPGTGGNSNSSMGLGFGMTTDIATGHSTASDYPQPFYYAFCRPVFGQIGVYWGNSGEEANIVTASTPAFVDTATVLELRVSPTQIRFRRQLTPTTWTEVVTNDTRLRGRYLTLMEDENGGFFRKQWWAMSVKQGIA